MLITVLNLSASASVEVPAPVAETLAPSASTTKAVQYEDFLMPNITGNPAWRQFEDLVKKGKISITLAPETGRQSSVLSALHMAQPARKMIGPWVQDNVAAAQADVPLALGVTANPQVDLVPTRGGSVVGISASFTVAPAGDTLVLKLLKNGVLVPNAVLSVAPGAALGRSVTFEADLFPFVAGDRLGVAVETPVGWTAVTSDVAVELEIEN